MVLNSKIIIVEMAKRIITKIGDIFYVDLENGRKKYFHYIANDLTQLNSDVIRVFKKEFLIDEIPNVEEILSMEIDFHAHTTINIGVKQNLFHQTGKYSVISDIKNILFRGTLDYGRKINNELIKISHNWRVWHINDKDFTNVGKLEGANKMAEIGIVIPPYAIVERIKTGSYKFFYPDFE